ncbi:hypothetical protein Tco_0656050 [Tanacetum coccineum]|uniref:Uncharacterized protein n=1 Tax=Tanacetum coccineum TaxID=301880 RepID=A0ABQ4X7V5_9ASTR
MQETILKQNYENFVASSQEGLDKTYNRFQKLISQLEIHSEVISQEDANLKLLRKNSSSNNETVNTTHSVSAASSNDQSSTASYADDEKVTMPDRMRNTKNQGKEKRFTKKECTSDTSTTNALVFKNDRRIIKYRLRVKDISIKDLKNQLEEALKEKDDLKLQLENFEESSKNLTKLINSQISAKAKTGLGYDSQINQSELNNIHKNESEVIHSVFNSRESNVDDNPVNVRFKTVRKTTTSVPEIETGISKTSKDIIEKPKTVRPSAPIIEEWDTDNDNDSVFRPKSDQTKPKFTKINFVKSGKNVKSVNKENTHRQVEYPRKSQSPRAVVTKSGQVPVNAAKQSSPRAATTISTGRGLLILLPPKPKGWNDDHYHMNLLLFTSTFTIAVSAAEGNGENDVKSSAC